MLAAAALVWLVLLWLERAPLGTVLRAIRDHEERTGYFGYDVAACKRFAFTVSRWRRGPGRGLFVTQFGFVSPALIGFSLSTEVLIWTALGGREVLLAAWLAAILVRTVEGILSEALGHYWLLALGVMFVVAVVYLPRGLLGWLLRLPLPRRLSCDDAGSSSPRRLRSDRAGDLPAQPADRARLSACDRGGRGRPPGRRLDHRRCGRCAAPSPRPRRAATSARPARHCRCCRHRNA